jgi:hypothetical protein
MDNFSESLKKFGHDQNIGQLFHKLNPKNFAPMSVLKSIDISSPDILCHGTEKVRTINCKDCKKQALQYIVKSPYCKDCYTKHNYRPFKCRVCNEMRANCSYYKSTDSCKTCTLEAYKKKCKGCKIIKPMISVHSNLCQTCAYKDKEKKRGKHISQKNTCPGCLDCSICTNENINDPLPPIFSAQEKLNRKNKLNELVSQKRPLNPYGLIEAVKRMHESNQKYSTVEKVEPLKSGAGFDNPCIDCCLDNCLEKINNICQCPNCPGKYGGCKYSKW